MMVNAHGAFPDMNCLRNIAVTVHRQLITIRILPTYDSLLIVVIPDLIV